MILTHFLALLASPALLANPAAAVMPLASTEPLLAADRLDLALVPALPVQADMLVLSVRER